MESTWHGGHAGSDGSASLCERRDKFRDSPNPDVALY
jgi:hypothetical protein